MAWVLVCALLAASGDALAVGEIADVKVIDRNGWLPLTTYFYRGEYWVAGKPGATYSIEIRNRLGERLLAVASVDGVNVISGATAGWDQPGYVFDPEQRYEITGWRKSDADVAVFTFTRSPNSYAARTGRPANIGVIGVAVFRERQPQRVDTPAVIGESPMPAEAPEVSRRADADQAKAQTAQAPSAVATLPSTNSAAAHDLDSAVPPVAPAPELARSYAREPSPPALERQTPAMPKLGTGHGHREGSYVTRVDFQRQQPEPNEIIRIRYDSLDNLIAMGIIERPHRGVPASNPFPASPGSQYVPDPPEANAWAVQ